MLNKQQLAARYATAIMNALVTASETEPRAAINASCAADALLVATAMVAESAPLADFDCEAMGAAFGRTVAKLMLDMRRQRKETGAGALDVFLGNSSPD